MNTADDTEVSIDALVYGYVQGMLMGNLPIDQITEPEWQELFKAIDCEVISIEQCGRDHFESLWHAVVRMSLRCTCRIVEADEVVKLVDGFTAPRWGCCYKAWAWEYSEYDRALLSANNQRYVVLISQESMLCA